MISPQNRPETVEIHDMSKLKQRDNDEYKSARFGDESAESEMEIRSNEAVDNCDNGYL